MQHLVSNTDRAVIGAFAKVASAIVAGKRREEVLTAIAASVHEFVDANLAAVTIRTADGDLLTVAAEGLDAVHYRNKRYPAAGTSTEHVLQTGETVVVNNLATVPVIGERLPGVALGPTVFVPIMLDGPYGSLSVSRLVGREPFTDNDIALIRTFAGQAALVFERDCQRRRAAELSRIAERARIAAELNESAIAEIFAASLQLARLANETANADRRIEVFQAIDTLDRAIKLIRQAAFGLDDRSTDTALD